MGLATVIISEGESHPQPHLPYLVPSLTITYCSVCWNQWGEKSLLSIMSVPTVELKRTT